MEERLKLPLNIFVSGATKSGKTFLCQKLLKDYLFKQCDILVILSPTINLSGDFSNFTETNQYTNTGSKQIQKQIYKFSENFEQVIEEIIEQQTDLMKRYPKKQVPQIIIVLDDCISESILSFRGPIDKLSTKSRHLNISLIILSQRISAIPRTFRLNTALIFILNMVNYSELERLCSDSVPKKMRKVLRNNIEKIFDEPYNYIMVDCFSSRVKDRLWKNGNERIYDLIHE